MSKNGNKLLEELEKQFQQVLKDQTGGMIWVDMRNADIRVDTVSLKRHKRGKWYTFPSVLEAVTWLDARKAESEGARGLIYFSDEIELFPPQLQGIFADAWGSEPRSTALNLAAVGRRSIAQAAFETTLYWICSNAALVERLRDGKLVEDDGIQFTALFEFYCHFYPGELGAQLLGFQRLVLQLAKIEI